jgi:hypothetical protein
MKKKEKEKKKKNMKKKKKEKKTPEADSNSCGNKFHCLSQNLKADYTIFTTS